jgi:2'-5' RNA ligase
MSDQFSLFAPPPEPGRSRIPAQRQSSNAHRHDVFFALRPNLQDGTRIAALAAAEGRRLGVHGKPLETARLHVSLYGMGSYGTVFPARDVEAWLRAAETVRMAPFDVVFDRIATFGGEDNPLVLKAGAESGIVGVQRFLQVLGEALADACGGIKALRKTPHMTVSYGGIRLAETPIERIRWTAGEFVLIDSHVGAHLHEVLGCWPLQA